MKMLELDNKMQFEFECDLILDAKMVAHFDDSRVTAVTDLLTEHNIDFVVKLGMNQLLQRTVTIQSDSSINQLFHYDLTTLMLQDK